MDIQAELKKADDLIQQGHAAFNKGDIGVAMMLQGVAHRIRRSIEKATDYEYACTGEGLRVLQDRAQKKADEQYQEFYNSLIKQGSSEVEG